MPNEIAYLACPYTHQSLEVRIARFEESARAAAHLIHKGMFVYSPITMTHPIDLVMASEGETMGSDYWCDFDEAFMRVCSEMIVLTVAGWRESNGIAREAAFFRGSHKPVRYMSTTEGGYVLTDYPQDRAGANDGKDTHSD